MKKYFFLNTLLILISCNNLKNTIAQESKSSEKKNHKLVTFDYKLLSKDSLICSQYTNLRHYTITTLLRDNVTYDQYSFQIDEEYGIKIYNYSPQKPDYNSPNPFANLDRDYLQIGNEKYIFDQILYGEDYKKYLNSMTIGNAYFFSFNNKNYFVCFITSATNSSHPNFLICLFDITVKESSELVLFEYQASYDIHCLGDFNQDKRLDFAFREQLGNKLICKTLNNNKFEILEGYHLKIIDSPHDPKIDLNNSNWFFDLTQSGARMGTE